MPSIKDLKKRIVSVKNTQQTTKAMKMVSAAKLRRAQEAIHAHRPYARAVERLIRRVSAVGNASHSSPLLGRERGDARTKALVVVVTSDRGLCGAFNSNVIKAAQRWIKANASSHETVDLGFVGRKGYEFFKTKNVGMGPYYSELGGKVSFEKAKKLTDSLIGLYLDGKYDEILFIYNEFKNAVTQRVMTDKFLPLAEMPEEEGAPVDEAPLDAIVKPDLPSVLEALLSKHFAAHSFRVMLESQAGEHGARMSAMENATKNAGEMIRKLSLQYNKQRQAGITKELLEIISGSESQKG